MINEIITIHNCKHILVDALGFESYNAKFSKDINGNKVLTNCEFTKKSDANCSIHITVAKWAPAQFQIISLPRWYPPHN